MLRGHTMIKKLRRKLMLLFLSFTILIFTAAMLLMIGNTCNKVQSQEIEYGNNMADSILELAQQSKDIETLELSQYSDYLSGVVFISDGKSQNLSSDTTDVSLNMLRTQIKSGENILYMQDMQESGTSIGSEQPNSRIVCIIHGSNKTEFYGVYSTFYANGIPYEIAVIYPRLTFRSILQNYCGWYPVIWVGVSALLFLVSRLLVGKAVQPVEAALQSQKEFIASASHELKSPLAVIQTNAETLDIKQSDTASEQKRNVILGECSRMSDLIRSLLSLAASDTGRWIMDMGTADVDTLLIEVWEEYAQPAQKRNLHLDLNINEHYPKLICDKDHIKQALGILLDNAISYSPPGLSIEMGARVTEKSMIFYVMDHGPGIAEKEKDKIFQRFYSGDVSRTDKNHYGLGLSIAVEIVKLHQGTIMLKDTPGGGCTFEIQLPLEKASS